MPGPKAAVLFITLQLAAVAPSRKLRLSDLRHKQTGGTGVHPPSSIGWSS